MKFVCNIELYACHSLRDLQYLELVLAKKIAETIESFGCEPLGHQVIISNIDSRIKGGNL